MKEVGAVGFGSFVEEVVYFKCAEDANEASDSHEKISRFLHSCEGITLREAGEFRKWGIVKGIPRLIV